MKPFAPGEKVLILCLQEKFSKRMSTPFINFKKMWTLRAQETLPAQQYQESRVKSRLMRVPLYGYETPIGGGYCGNNSYINHTVVSVLLQ